jgi:hypothetical protein
MVVSSARVKIFMEKHEEVCMNILIPEDKTIILSQNNEHQSMTCHHIPDLNYTTAKA